MALRALVTQRPCPPPLCFPLHAVSFVNLHAASERYLPLLLYPQQPPCLVPVDEGLLNNIAGKVIARQYTADGVVGDFCDASQQAGRMADRHRNLIQKELRLSIHSGQNSGSSIRLSQWRFHIAVSWCNTSPVSLRYRKNPVRDSRDIRVERAASSTPFLSSSTMRTAVLRFSSDFMLSAGREWMTTRVERGI